MKTIFKLLLVSAVLLVGVSQNLMGQYSYNVKVNKIVSTGGSDGSSSDPDYSAWVECPYTNGTIDEHFDEGSAPNPVTFMQGYILESDGQLNSPTITFAMRAWEEDYSSHQNYNTGSIYFNNDEHYEEFDTSYNFLGTRPSSPVSYWALPSFGNNHKLFLEMNWQYKAISTYISPTCTIQTNSDQSTINFIPMNMVKLTAGNTYKFVSSTNHQLRLYGINGYTCLDSCTSNLSGGFTYAAGTTGYYFLEISAANRSSIAANTTYAYTYQSTGSVINIKGNGNTIADGDVTPSTTDHTKFNDLTACGGSNHTRTYTIENTGSISLKVNDIQITGQNASNFTLGGITFPHTISAGGTKTFTVTFNPSLHGNRDATVTVQSDACNIAYYDFDLYGKGLGPEADVFGNTVEIQDGDVTPSLQDSTAFGQVDVWYGKRDITYTIKNQGNTNLIINNISLTQPHTYIFTYLNNPTFPVTVVPADQFTFTIRFNPALTGPDSAIITITNNDCLEGTYTFKILGTGVSGSRLPGEGDQDINSTPKLSLTTFPNPFSDQINIQFNTQPDAPVAVNIYNLQGQLVRTLYNGNASADKMQLTWDGTAEDGSILSNGLYFMEVIVNGAKETSRVQVMRQ